MPDTRILELPFNQHVGLSLIMEEGEEVLSLEPQDCHLNHLGTVHAAALYSLAEAASGHALLKQLELNSSAVIPVLRSSTMKYRRPANRALLALATIDEEKVSEFDAQLNARGRLFIEVSVRIMSGSVEVCQGVFSWYVSRVGNG